jgi:hypothetical protein
MPRKQHGMPVSAAALMSAAALAQQATSLALEGLQFACSFLCAVWSV